MEFKGSKGEWFPNLISTITIGVNSEISRNNGGIYSQNVCEFILPETDEEYEKERVEIEANAKLIASAPEMLLALQKILALGNTGLSLMAAKKYAKVAIEKALK